MGLFDFLTAIVRLMMIIVVFIGLIILYGIFSAKRVAQQAISEQNPALVTKALNALNKRVMI